MKKTSTLVLLLVLFANGVSAQCGTGYTNAQLNWDHLDFLPSNNTRYTTVYPSAAFPYSQNFAIGTRRLNFTMAPTGNITLNGENGTHTGHAGSFATGGDDVQFTTTTSASTTIIMSFDEEVANVRFSIFDLDANQRINFTAYNDANVAQTITVVRASGSSGINITGSGSINVTATGPGTGYG